MSDDPKVSASADQVQNDADAAKPTSVASETPAADTDAGETELARLRRENLEAKIRAEEKNKLIEELSRQRHAPIPPPAGVDPRAQQLQEALLNVSLRAQAGDPDALLTLASLQQQQQQQKELQDELAIARMPLDDQDAVRKLYNENRQRFGDPDVAYAYHDRGRLKSRASELDTRTKELKDAETRKRDGVVSVTTRPVAHEEAKIVRMSGLDEFEAKHKELMAQGKNAEAWDLSRRAATGELFRS